MLRRHPRSIGELWRFRPEDRAKSLRHEARTATVSFDRCVPPPAHYSRSKSRSTISFALTGGSLGIRVAHALDRLPTVVLADDHQAMLKRVTDILSPRFKVVAAVDNGKSALDAMARASPDVAVLDIMMPQLDGITVARELKRRDSGAKIVFLTAQEDDDYISEALRAGARGYVVKRRLQTELVPALDLVIGGKFFVSPHPFGGKGQAENGHLLDLYLEDSAFF